VKLFTRTGWASALESIRHVLASIDYEHKDQEVARPADSVVVQPASAVMKVPAGPA
jgi:hypothetical protein